MVRFAYATATGSCVTPIAQGLSNRYRRCCDSRKEVRSLLTESPLKGGKGLRRVSLEHAAIRLIGDPRVLWAGNGNPFFKGIWDMPVA